MIARFGIQSGGSQPQPGLSTPGLRIERLARDPERVHRPLPLRLDLRQRQRRRAAGDVEARARARDGSRPAPPAGHRLRPPSRARPASPPRSGGSTAASRPRVRLRSARRGENRRPSPPACGAGVCRGRLSPPVLLPAIDTVRSYRIGLSLSHPLALRRKMSAAMRSGDHAARNWPAGAAASSASSSSAARCRRRGWPSAVFAAVPDRRRARSSRRLLGAALLVLLRQTRPARQRSRCRSRSSRSASSSAFRC